MIPGKYVLRMPIDKQTITFTKLENLAKNAEK